MNRKAILANVMVLAVLAGCEGMDSPVAPEPVAVGTGAAAGPGQTPVRTELTTVLSTTLAGAESLAMTFSSFVPVGDQVAGADSLSVVVTNLLEGGLSLNLAPRFSTSTTSNSGIVEDGEPIKVSGVSKVHTSKVNYSDGTSEWDQEITTSDFVIQGKKSGGECKSQEQERFRAKSGPGATVFQQRARSAVVCPGDGRVYFVHVNIQTVISPSGNVNSHVKETCVSRREDQPTC